MAKPTHTVIYRHFSIGPDRSVVTCDDSSALRLMGYSGAGHRDRARTKAEALATWERFNGRKAVVLDVPQRVTKTPVAEPHTPLDVPTGKLTLSA